MAEPEIDKQLFIQTPIPTPSLPSNPIPEVYAISRLDFQTLENLKLYFGFLIRNLVRTVILLGNKVKISKKSFKFLHSFAFFPKVVSVLLSIAVKIAKVILISSLVTLIFTAK